MTERSTEIIAVTSGKGGTGKTLVSSCLGFALTRAGHRVLLVDADLATDGLSLYLLGPQGIGDWESFRDENTFASVLRRRSMNGVVGVVPRPINRSASGDHGVIYDALISSRGLYGDLPPPNTVDRDHFRVAVGQLFDGLRSRAEFDYIIVDTRGGFSFETADVCALADSFILVTEADFTSFYQSRNLVQEVGASAEELGREPRLRAIFVNKALEKIRDSGELDLAAMEVSFRLEVVKEFESTGIKFEDTHPVPLDSEVLMAYKEQKAPFLHRPAYRFSYAMLSAFAQILRVVTSPWTREQVKQWNELVDSVSEVIAAENTATRVRANAEASRTAEVETLRAEVGSLRADTERRQRELDEMRDRYQRELARSQALINRLAPAQVSVPTPPVMKRTPSRSLSALRRIVSGLIWVTGAALLGVVAIIVIFSTGQFIMNRISTALRPPATATPIVTVVPSGAPTQAPAAPVPTVALPPTAFTPAVPSPPAAPAATARPAVSPASQAAPARPPP